MAVRTHNVVESHFDNHLRIHSPPEALIIQRVGGGNLVELVFSQQPSEEIVSKFPRRRLKALFAFRRMCLHIAAFGQELQVITGGQSAHKLLVGFRLCTPELVIKMNDGEDDAQILPEFEQKAQQGSGIRSAGDGHPDAVASPQQIVFADILQDRLAEPVHGNILYARHCEGGRREPTIALERGAGVRKTES